MKKFLQNIVLAGILISTPILNVPLSIETPRDLSIWLKENFTYQKEALGKDYWKTPKETIKDKGGDCEDFAILTQHILKKLGYNAQFIVIEYYEKSSNHAICIVKHKDGTFSYFSNQFYFKTRYKSIPKLLSAHANSWSVTWKKAWVIFSKSTKMGLPLWRNRK